MKHNSNSADDVKITMTKDGDKIKYKGTYKDIQFEGEGEFETEDGAFNKIESEFEAKGHKMTKDDFMKIRAKMLSEMKTHGIQFGKGGDMTTSMKETYGKINWSKVHGSIKDQFDTIKNETENFSDKDLMDVYESNFNDLVDIVKKKHPEAIGGKAEPKSAKEKNPAKGKKAKKEKKVKPAKEPILFKGKPLSEASCDELIKDYRERREKSKQNAKKSKTKSIFEKVTDKVEAVVEQAIKSVSAENSANPTAFADKIDKLAEATEEYLKNFKGILGEEYSAKEMADVVKEIEAVADKIRKHKKK